MADSREAQTQTLETVGLTTKGLLQIIGFALAVAATLFSVVKWSEHSLDTAIIKYDAGYISPKIERNAWVIKHNENAIEDIRQEHKEFRNEVKRMMDSQEADTKKIVNHLLVNRK